MRHSHTLTLTPACPPEKSILSILAREARDDESLALLHSDLHARPPLSPLARDRLCTRLPCEKESTSALAPTPSLSLFSVPPLPCESVCLPQERLAGESILTQQRIRRMTCGLETKPIGSNAPPAFPAPNAAPGSMMAARVSVCFCVWISFHSLVHSLTHAHTSSRGKNWRVTEGAATGMQ